MQDCEEGSCEDMIVADPNMILSVTVPETVQKQAEKWQRGTRTLQHNSVLRSGRTYLASYESYESEGKLHISSMGGQETDQSGKPTDQTNFKHKCSKTSAWQDEERSQPSKHYEKGASGDHSLQDRLKTSQKPSQGKPRQAAFACSSSHPNCDNSKPFLAERNCSLTDSFLHPHVQQANPAPADSKSVVAVTDLLNNCGQFKSSRPSQAPRDSFQQDSKTASSDVKTPSGFTASCIVTESSKPKKNFEQQETLKLQKGHQHEHVKQSQAVTAIPCHVRSGDSLNRIGKEPSPGKKTGRDSTKRQQTTTKASPTTTTTSTKQSRQTVAARSSMRVRYRQWMDSKKAAAAQDPNASKQTCYRYSAGRRTLSKRGGELQHQAQFTSPWPQPGHQLARSINSSAAVDDSLAFRLRQSRDIIVGLCDVAHTSGSEDLVDLSVEETVEFFLSMTSRFV